MAGQAKRLKFANFEVQKFPDGRAQLVVRFLDGEANQYVWTPQWVHVQQLLLKSVNTEQFNRPKGPWVKDFAEAARQVFQNATSDIVEAELVEGTFAAYREQKLVIELERKRPAVFPLDVLNLPIQKLLPAAFEVTPQFLRRWLNSYVHCLVINGIAVEIWHEGDFGQLLSSYPEPRQEGG